MTSASDFWKGAGERAGKTALQGFVGTLGLQAVGVVTPQVFGDLPWATALLTALTLGFLSLATSILNPSFTAGTSTTSSDPLDGVELSPYDTQLTAEDDGTAATDTTSATETATTETAAPAVTETATPTETVPASPPTI